MTGWLAVLGAAAGVFTAPGYRLFCDLMTGWVLTPGRHTITRVLTLADTDGRRAHDAYHRFVRAGRWATARLWRVLTVHAVALTCPDGVVELLVDDTLAHKSGRTVAGAGSFRDAVRSTSKRVVYAWGLNVVVVCLRVDPPWGGTPIALPLNLRIRAKKNGKKTTELAAEMVAEIAGWLPDRRFHLTGDGAYACLAGAALPHTHLTARLRRDAALYQPAPPRTGRRGRPRARGARLGKPPELAAAVAANAWQQAEVDSPQPPSHPAGRSVRRALVRGLQGRSGAAGRRPRPRRHPTRRLLRDHRPVHHRSPDRHPLRRPLAHRVLLQGRQAARRGRAPADLEGQWAGPRGDARLLAAHRRVVLLPRRLERAHLARPALVYPQGHPELSGRPRRAAPRSVAPANYQHVIRRTAARRNSRSAARHPRGGRIATTGKSAKSARSANFSTKKKLNIAKIVNNR